LYVWGSTKNFKCVGLYPKHFLGGCSVNQKKNFFFDLATHSWHTFTFIKKTRGGIDFINFFYSFNFFFFKKFKFVGKGYKIKKVKIKKSFKFYFGYSHKIFLVYGGAQLRKLTKYKLFLLGNNQKKIQTILLILKNIRKLNMFTKRGLRATKQIIHKRPGKKSTY
jgi:ribosomal protein L6P/L9E